METCTQNIAYLHLELLNSKWHFQKIQNANEVNVFIKLPVVARDLCS